MTVEVKYTDGRTEVFDGTAWADDDAVHITGEDGETVHVLLFAIEEWKNVS